MSTEETDERTPLIERVLTWIANLFASSTAIQTGFKEYIREDGNTVHEGGWSTADGLWYRVVTDANDRLVSFFVESAREQSLSWDGSELTFSSVYIDESVNAPRLDATLDREVYMGWFVGSLLGSGVPQKAIDDVERILLNGGR